MTECWVVGLRSEQMNGSRYNALFPPLRFATTAMALPPPGTLPVSSRKTISMEVPDQSFHEKCNIQLS